MNTLSRSLALTWIAALCLVGCEAGGVDTGLPPVTARPDMTPGLADLGGFTDRGQMQQDFDRPPRDLGAARDQMGGADAELPYNEVGLPVGSACTDAAQCIGYALCNTDVPDGYCTSAFCDLYGCPGERDVCIPITVDQAGTTVGFCFQGCAMNTECRQGYSCVIEGDEGEGVCSPEDPGSMMFSGELDGAPCTADLECAGALCILTEDGWPQGVLLEQLSAAQRLPRRELKRRLALHAREHWLRALLGALLKQRGLPLRLPV